MKYVRCEGHCKYPAYDKEEIDNLFYKKTEMDTTLNQMHNDLVKPNEVYFKGDFAVLTGQVTMTSGAGSTTTNYPEGFTRDNSVVISFGQENNDTKNSVNFGYGIRSTDYTKGSITRNVSLKDSEIEISVYNAVSEGSGDKTYNYKIVLMKIA